MSKLFKFNYSKFFNEMVLQMAMQSFLFAFLVYLMYRSGNDYRLFAIIFTISVVYMVFENIKYNPKNMEFDDYGVVIEYGKILKYSKKLKISKDNIVKATLTTRKGKLHSFIMLHKFTDSKVRPIKVHLRYIEDPRDFESHIKEYFPTIYEADIKR